MRLIESKTNVKGGEVKYAQGFVYTALRGSPLPIVHCVSGVTPSSMTHPHSSTQGVAVILIAL